MSDQLSTFQQHFAAFRPDDPGDFRSLLVEGMTVLDVSPTELCEEFDVSLPGLNEWLTGRSTPHPAVRRIVANHLASIGASRAEQVSVSLNRALALH
jgi:hypothetical protein